MAAQALPDSPSGGMSLRDIAEAAGTNHSKVRRLLVSGLAPYDSKRSGVPRDVGGLVATVMKADITRPSASELMKTDPAQVLEAALALAELARRALAEQARQGKVTITEMPQAA